MSKRNNYDLAKSVDAYFKFEYSKTLREIDGDVERDSMLDAASRRILLSHILAFRRDVIGLLNDNSKIKYESDFSPSLLKFKMVDLDAEKVSRLWTSETLESYALFVIKCHLLFGHGRLKINAESKLPCTKYMTDHSTLISALIHSVTFSRVTADFYMIGKYLKLKTIRSLCSKLMEDFNGYCP